MSIEVLLNTEDISVLGPPTIIETLVDIGPKGTRGSKIWVGPGDPEVFLVSQTILINDLYINSAPGADYSFLYQYINQPGGASWVKVLKVNPTLYTKKHSTTFTDGESQILIPISEITSESISSYTVDNFNVQYSITTAAANPISSSISLPAIEIDDENLVINLKAIEYSGSAWQDLDGSAVVNIFISLIMV